MVMPDRFEYQNAITDQAKRRVLFRPVYRYADTETMGASIGSAVDG